MSTERVPVLARQQHGCLTARQLEELGVSRATVRSRVARCRWLRLHRGVYLVDGARDPADPWVQAQAASLAVPDGIVVGATAAATWRLSGYPPGPPEVAVPRGRSLATRSTLLVRTKDVPPSDVVVRRGVRMTSEGRTLQDVLRSHDRLVGLAVCDSALRQGRLTSEDLVRLGEAVAGTAGTREVADVWALADGRAETPLESRVRLRAVDGGHPPTDLQVRLRDHDGRVRARGDMGYDERARTRGRTGWLLVEADGRVVHSSPEAVHGDRSKHNLVTALGHDSVRFVWRDTLDAYAVPRAIGAAR